MFLIERSCRETFKNSVTHRPSPSEDGEPPTPRWLFSVISGYFVVTVTALLIKEINCYNYEDGYFKTYTNEHEIF